MDESSHFSDPEYPVKSETYIKYRNELELVEKLHKEAMEKIEKIGKLQDFVRSKSAEADNLKNLEEAKGYTQVEEKLEQVRSQGLLSLNQDKINEVVTAAKNRFKEDLEGAFDTYTEIMEEAIDNFDDDDSAYPEDQINEARDKYEEGVKEAWRSFKEEIRDGTDVKQAASNFGSEIAKAREEFEEEVKSEIDAFVEGIDEQAKAKYEQTVNEAVEEYGFWVQTALRTFCITIDQLVEECQTKMGQSPGETESQREKAETDSEQTEDVMQSSTVANPSDHDEKLRTEDKEQLESLTVEKGAGNQDEEDFPSDFEVIETVKENQLKAENSQGNEDHGVGLRLKNLEGTMSEMLKAMQEMNERFASLQVKLEHQDQEKVLMDSLEKEMSEFRASRMKEIEEVMSKLKDEGDFN